MKIQYLGHSCFKLTESTGTTVITDPYGRIGYELPKGLKADAVTVSHDHFDHNNVKAIGGRPLLIDKEGFYELPGVEITARPCPLFVPLVEAGYVDHSALDKQQVTRLVIAQYLAEVREAGVDTLILGCTHYPLIKEMIGWYMGRNVTLVDPAQTAAHHLERTLSEHGLKGNHEKGEAHFYVSDVPDSFAQTADLFLGEYKGGLIDQIAIDKY